MPEKIDLNKGLEVESAKKINEIAANNSKDFSDALKKQVEGINNKKELANDILNAIDKGKNSIKEDQISIFKTLLDNIAQLDPDIKNSPDFKKRASIVDNIDNFALWKQVINSKNIKATIENSDITDKIKNLGLQDQALKDYLNGVIGSYKKMVEAKQKEINGLPLYQLETYGIIYNAKTGDLQDKNNNQFFPLFNVIENNQREYNPKIIKEKDNKTYLILNDTTKTELTKMKVPSSVREHIGYMLSQNDMQGLDYTQIKKYIDETDTPTKQEKEDLLLLVTEAKRLNPTDAAKYDILTGQLNQTKTKESQEKTEKDINKEANEIISQKPSIEIAKKLFDNGEKREVTNKILETAKNNQQSLSPDQKDNITNLIKLYLEKSEPVISEALTYATIQDAIKIGKELNHRPETYNGLPVYVIQIKKPGDPVKYIEVFPGTEKDIHTARSQAIDTRKTIDGDTLQPYESYDKDKNTIDLRKLGDGVTMDQFIFGSHEFGSYMTLQKIFQMQPSAKDYLKNNLGTVLESVKTSHKNIVDSSVDHTNGYYRVIAETITSTGDKGIIQAYLTHIESNPSYLGDGQSRIDTRNIVAKRGDANILHSQGNEQLKGLYTRVKMQIDPNGTKKEILEQVDDAMDKFFEQYGDIIAQVVDFFGGKGTFMKYLPDNLKEKFREKFKEKFQMSEIQAKNFDEINKSFDTIDNKPQNDPTTAIEGLQKEATDKGEKGKIQALLTDEKNFSKLSPNLVSNIIKEYNKKPKDSAKIEMSDFIQVDAKGKPEKIKSGTDTGRKIIIDKLLDTGSTLRNTIKSTHNEVTANATKEFEKSDKSIYTMDINGSSVDKGIKSYRDVATYIAAYVTTGGQPPFKHVIAENDIVATQTNHKSINKKEQAEKTPEQKHGETITTISKIIESGKYKNGSADADFPTDYDGKNNQEYEKNIIIPINDIFKADKLTGDNTIFAETIKNIDKLAALKAKPQVIKDLLQYKLNKETEEQKKKPLNDILALFTTDVTEIKDIKEDNKNIVVQINDTKKFTIKSGPVFELIQQT